MGSQFSVYSVSPLRRYVTAFGGKPIAELEHLDPERLRSEEVAEFVDDHERQEDAEERADCAEHCDRVESDEEHQTETPAAILCASRRASASAAITVSRSGSATDSMLLQHRFDYGGNIEEAHFLSRKRSTATSSAAAIAAG